MNLTTVGTLAIALAEKAPGIYDDIKYLIELLIAGKAPTADDLAKINKIMADNELTIDSK